MSDVRYLIEPAKASGVIHGIIGGGSIAGIPGRWRGYCGTIVAGIILEADLVDGTPCRKCEARASKYARK